MGEFNAKTTIIAAGAAVVGLGLVTLLFYQSFWLPYTNLKTTGDLFSELAVKSIY